MICVTNYLKTYLGFSTLMVNHKFVGRSDSRIIVLSIVLSMLIFIVDSMIPLGVAGGVPYILVILVSLWSPRKRLPVYVAIWTSVLTIAGLFSSPAGGETWKVLFNRSLALFAIWVTAFLSVQREKALLQVKILSGLLPICASCKKIRDDKGYWNRIEVYIMENSEAKFTHGICQECREKLYPDIVPSNHHNNR